MFPGFFQFDYPLDYASAFRLQLLFDVLAIILVLLCTRVKVTVHQTILLQLYNECAATEVEFIGIHAW